MARPGDARFGKLQVDWRSHKQLQSALRHAADEELPKAMGRANKSVGQFIIDRLTPPPVPEAVGTGRGSNVRASASRRDVMLRVGGSHRAANVPLAPWGRRIGRLIRSSAPPRPHVLGTAEKHRDDIERAYLDAVRAAMSGAFHDVDV